MTRCLRLVRLGLLASVLLTAGCAAVTSLPQEIRNPPADHVSFSIVRQAPDEHEGRRVRWGGRIAVVENRESGTWIEVVEQPLDLDGRPRDVNASRGRFIVHVPGFLDPVIYDKGRRFTVTGAVLRGAEGSIGDMPYLFPIIRADRVHLWD